MKNRNLTEKFRGLSRKRKIGLACAAVCLVIFGTLLYNFPVYQVGLTCGDKYFDREDLLLLCFRGTPGDRRAAEKILDQGRAALEDRETRCDIYGENDPRRAKHGALWRLVTGPDAPDTGYTLKLLSAHLGINEGKVWVQYSKSGRGSEVELWTVQKINGEWVVVDTDWEA